MKRPFQDMTRRSFLAAAALVPIGTLLNTAEDDKYHYHYDHILGTSMDLVLWTRDARAAERAREMIIDEILRLNSILNTRESQSEISMLGSTESTSMLPSRDLEAVLEAYRDWERRTGGLLSIHPAGHPAGKNPARNVDALGKAYIIDRAMAAARLAVPELNSTLLNIGGDIACFGRTQEIGVTNPHEPHDNALPITRVSIQNA